MKKAAILALLLACQRIPEEPAPVTTVTLPPRIASAAAAPVMSTRCVRPTPKTGYEPVMEFTKEGSAFKRHCQYDVSPEEMMKVLLELQRIDREEFGLVGAELLSPQAYGKTCHMQETSVHF
ncbi:MAG: hypothetical protein WCI05_01245, partial [Myxococcales bacterium]